jgi:hypothetical protein
LTRDFSALFFAVDALLGGEALEELEEFEEFEEFEELELELLETTTALAFCIGAFFTRLTFLGGEALEELLLSTTTLAFCVGTFFIRLTLLGGEALEELLLSTTTFAFCIGAFLTRPTFLGGEALEELLEELLGVASFAFLVGFLALLSFTLRVPIRRSILLLELSLISINNRDISESPAL